mgnify:CR=1 FL=1
MAKKPQSTSSIKTTKADSAAAKPVAAKTEAAKPAADAAAASPATAADTAGSTKKAAAPSRPISYFSAVATEDYRAGWDSIFGKSKNKASAKPAKRAAAKSGIPDLPVTLTLDAEDVDAPARAALESVLRREAKKKRLNFDKLAKNGQVRWQITCRISSV